jgi:hypothetical protein
VAAPCSQWIACSPVRKRIVAGRSTRSLDIMAENVGRLGAARNALARVGASLARPFSWWLHIAAGKQTSIFLMPDSMSIFIIFCSVGLFAPWLIDLALDNVIGALCVVFVSPLIFLGVLVVDTRAIVYVRLFGVVPYWITQIPKTSRFELYESFDDTSSTGVAFRLSESKYLHLGTKATAQSLFTAILSKLERNGWRRDQFGGITPPPAGHDV